MSSVLDSGSGPAAEQTPAGEVCIPNISTRERRKRLTGGVIELIVTLVVLAVLMAIGASSW